MEIYAAELQSLSMKCDFGNSREQFVCEQFIEGCRSDKLRERLCGMDSLTLTKVLETASTLQNIEDRKSVLTGHHSSVQLRAEQGPALQIAAVQPAASSRRKPAAAVSKGRKPTPAPRHVQCYNCGVQGHIARDQICPARERTCRKCGRKGHYAKCCKASGKAHVVQVMSVIGPDKPLWTDVLVRGQVVRMMTDTGSSVSILPSKLYWRLCRDLPLQRAQIQLQAYGGQRLDVKGVVTVDVSARDGKACVC